MRYKSIILVTEMIIFFLFLLTISSAFEIKSYKPVYLIGETFQAEISGNFTRDLTIEQVHFFKNGIEQFPAFFFIKISQKQYFIYFDLQSEGNYTLQVKNALYYDNGILKGDTKNAEFVVENTLVSEYNSLINQVKEGWPNSVEENAYALLALSYDDALAIQGRNALMSKGNGECWPASSCNVKDTALALLALGSQTDSKWLVDAQNNLDVGLWDLVINAANDYSCNLSIDNENQTKFAAAGINSFPLDIKDKKIVVNISISCPSSFTPKIVHTYLGKTTEFNMISFGNLYKISLNNSKCYGKSYRDACNIESGAYALLALDALNLDKKGLLDWLKTNAATTKEKAITNKFSSSFDDWLINNQHNRGYWSNSSLAISQTPDTESTIFASWSLDNEKGKEWVKNNIANFNFKNKILALAFLFPYEDIENIISITPAFIKPGQKIELILRNNGLRGVNVSSKFLLTNEIKKVYIAAGKSSKIDFNITNYSVVLSSIEINYPEKSGKEELQYTIPILLSNPQANQTIQITPSQITSSNFAFLPQSLNLTLLIDEEITIKIFIKNLSPNPIKNLTLTFTRDFAKILKISPEKIDLEGGKLKQINLTFTTSREGKYKGDIEASSNNVSIKFPINLTVTKNASQINIPNNTIIIENKTCVEYNGTICKIDEKCSISFKNTADATKIGRAHV